MLMNLDDDGDGSYEENSQQKISMKTPKSQSSVIMSNEQVCKNSLQNYSRRTYTY